MTRADSAGPATAPSRTPHDLGRFFETTCDRRPGALAVQCGAHRLTYRELDRRANRLARLLADRGAGPGDRIGILLERSPETYVALLAVLKSGAAYVPLDPGFPAERLEFIAADAGLLGVVTSPALRERAAGLGRAVFDLGALDGELADFPDHRPEIEISPADAAYVIYTSGSTGRPKGVVISHEGIVNFLLVATPIYGVTAEDRVYQGMSLSFDFHLEEMWPAWVAGAALIAGPTDARRFGEGLAEFLTEHRITVFCSVPTLLTTMESTPASVRCLLVSGEAMPPDLVRRWAAPGRRILNCYGPTEATVSASCRELHPDRPVTLGRPFPTYRFYLLDQDLREVEEGGEGEICIGGPGVALGYLNRPGLTAERFVPNPVAGESAYAPRIYRTGDLGRRTATGEYEYLGRLDTQVKIRGYRIELGEIEQLIRADPAVENAVVVPVHGDLVGYVTLQNGTDDGLRDRVHTTLRRKLAAYMVPAYLEVLDRFPLLAADKVDRNALPPPTSPPLGAVAGPRLLPETELETEIAEIWSEVLDLQDLSVGADFFCDLGGHSLSAARVVSRLRQQPALRTLAMGDLYEHPTVRALAAFAETAAEVEPDSEVPSPLRHSTARFVACGLAQLALLYGWLLLLSVPALVLGYAIQLQLRIWPVDLPVHGPVELLAGLDLLPLAALCLLWFSLTLFLLPIIGSRLLLRKVRPGWYPLWGSTYLRHWFYGRMVALAPIALLTSTPLLPRYLRLLGAKVGADCHLGTQLIGLPKFVELGDGVSLGVLSRVQPYLVRDGWLRIAPIRIGDGCFVGSTSVVLAGAELGDGAALGPQSLLHADQRVAAGEYWAGSPSRRLDAAPAPLRDMAAHAPERRWRPSVLLGYLTGALVLRLLPLLMVLPSALLVLYGAADGGLGWAAAATVAAGPLQVLLSCLLLIAGKRLAMNSARPGVYPWRSGFGVRLWFTGHLLQLSLGVLSTIYCTLYVIPFLRGLGMKLGRWSEVATPAYVDPDLCRVGDRSFLAGGVVLSPAVFHAGKIALATAELDRGTFVGNQALLPGGSRLAEQSLLGVLSVPPERPTDPETTWLGSPPFLLVRRQPSRRFPAKYLDRPTPGLIAGRLVIELARVALPEIILLLSATLGFWLMSHLGGVLGAWLLLAMPLLWWVSGLFATAQVIALKWLLMGRYRPRTEPYWGLWVRGTELITGLYQTVAQRSLITQFLGTPWAAPVMRLFGARIGRRVWFNDAAMTEFDLVEIGDDAMIGEFCDLQTHLFEDRVMKMSRVRVEAGATIGTHAVVLYDAVVRTGAYVDAFSLVMKGEELPAGSGWRGIPARPL